jgi:hypothetical protein
VIGTVTAALMLFALLTGASSVQHGTPSVPTGPGGEPVTDSFYFVHRPLTGNGSMTVSVSALNSSIPTTPTDLRPGSVPWAKAGLIIKDRTRQGSTYAAIMVTGGHGVSSGRRSRGGFSCPATGPCPRSTGRRCARSCRSSTWS